MNKTTLKSLTLILILLSIPLTIFLSKQIQYLVSKATYQQANLIIDTANQYNQINPTWQALTQGGEIESDSLTPVSFADTTDYLKKITPQYIRIDHIFDFYQPAIIENGQITSYSWLKLDKVVNDIIASGATPFFSLSYFPPALTDDGTPIGNIKDWGVWQQLVSQLASRYSGNNQKNIPNIAYEVWNEPDLFGSFKPSYGKNYLDLYYHCTKPISQLDNLNSPIIGGPATTALYPNWIKALVSFTQTQSLPLDFISFHRYSQNPFQFKKDILDAKKILSQFPNTKNIKVYITEWGPDSNPNPIYGTSYSAIHTLASSIQMQSSNVLAFSFEIKDGPGENNNGWGLFTNQNSSTTPKPRFYALEFLNQLKGDSLFVKGQNSTVTALATIHQDTTSLLVVNFPQGSYTQDVIPITFQNLNPATYTLKIQTLFSKTQAQDVTIKENNYQFPLYLKSNQAALISLQKTKDLATFEPGPFNYQNDLGLIFDQNVPQLTFSPDKLNLEKGTIEFYLKPTFLASVLEKPTILSLPLDNNQFFLIRKDHLGFSDVFSAGIFDKDKNPIFVVNTPIHNMQQDNWYHLAVSYDTTLSDKSFLKIYLDGKIKDTNQKDFSLVSRQNLTIGNFQGGIDELRFSSIPLDPYTYYYKPLKKDNNTLSLYHFDGKTSR